MANLTKNKTLLYRNDSIRIWLDHDENGVPFIKAFEGRGDGVLDISFNKKSKVSSIISKLNGMPKNKAKRSK